MAATTILYRYLGPTTLHWACTFMTPCPFLLPHRAVHKSWQHITPETAVAGSFWHHVDVHWFKSICEICRNCDYKDVLYRKQLHNAFCHLSCGYLFKIKPDFSSHALLCCPPTDFSLQFARELGVALFTLSLQLTTKVIILRDSRTMRTG